MNTKSFKCSIVSAEKAIHEGDAVFVSMIGEMGELGIMPGHAPLMTELVPGAVEIRQLDGSVFSFYVSGGIAQVLPKEVTIMADIAEKSDELDEARAQEVRSQLLESLHSGTGTIDYATTLAKLAATNAQLLALRKLRRKN